MYIVNVYNGVCDLENRGAFKTFEEAIAELRIAEVEYMAQFNYEYGTTEYNQELENFLFNSRIEKRE